MSLVRMTVSAEHPVSATPAQREFFDRTLAGAVTDDVARMREIIAKGGLSGEMPGIDGKSWFDVMTARIDRLKIVEDPSFAFRRP